MLVELKQTRQPRRTLPHAGCLPAWFCSALLRVSGPVSAPCAASHCACTKLRPWRAARASRRTTAGVPACTKLRPWRAARASRRTTAGVPAAPAKLAIHPCRRPPSTSSPELSSLALDSLRLSSASPALLPAASSKQSWWSPLQSWCPWACLARRRRP